jgi:hypothetical protein
VSQQTVDPPDHVGAIAAAIRPAYIITCGLCSFEETGERDSAEMVVLGFLQAGWRKAGPHRGNYLMCPGCYNAPRGRAGCSCRACILDRDERIGGIPAGQSGMRMIVCQKCGNKRCPHANDHRHECTNSNETGQHGSAYP